MRTQILRQRSKSGLHLFLKCDLEGIWNMQIDHRLEIKDKEFNTKLFLPLPNRFWAIMFWQNLDLLLDDVKYVTENEMMDLLISVATKLDKMSDSDPPHILHKMSTTI